MSEETYGISEIVGTSKTSVDDAIRTAINKAKKENRTVRIEQVRVSRNGVARTIHLEVIPLLPGLFRGSGEVEARGSSPVVSERTGRL